jgi:hypothetical protein
MGAFKARINDWWKAIDKSHLFKILIELRAADFKTQIVV